MQMDRMMKMDRTMKMNMEDEHEYDDEGEDGDEDADTDEDPTNIQRISNEDPTNVQRGSNEHPTKIQRISNEQVAPRRHSRRVRQEERRDQQVASPCAKRTTRQLDNSTGGRDKPAGGAWEEPAGRTKDRKVENQKAAPNQDNNKNNWPCPSHKPARGDMGRLPWRGQRDI